jgi:hypothetical protein
LDFRRIKNITEEQSVTFKYQANLRVNMKHKTLILGIIAVTLLSTIGTALAAPSNFGGNSGT